MDLVLGCADVRGRHFGLRSCVDFIFWCAELCGQHFTTYGAVCTSFMCAWIEVILRCVTLILCCVGLGPHFELCGAAWNLFQGVWTQLFGFDFRVCGFVRTS